MTNAELQKKILELERLVKELLEWKERKNSNKLLSH